MEPIQDKLSATVLIGGNSTRAGFPKYKLKFKGDLFINHITTVLNPLMINYSTRNYVPDLNHDLQLLDQYDNIGPIGGIATSLSHSQTDYVLITSCDIPNLSHDLVVYMIGQFVLSQQPLIAKVNNKIMPTFGIYRKDDLSILSKQIEKGDYKLLNLLELIKPTYIDIPNRFKEDLVNINTIDELRTIDPYIFSVCGYKNSGKTTLINKLINKFASDGLSVSCLKHDGHDFTVDTSTDSGKFINNQTKLVTVYSSTKYQTTVNASFSLTAWLDNITTEIVIIEGLKDSDYSKVVIENEKKLDANNRLITLNCNTRDEIDNIYQIIRKEIDGRYK